MIDSLLKLMQDNEFKMKLFKKCVREFVDDSTYKKISDLYNQKLAEAKSDGYKKSDLTNMFK